MSHDEELEYFGDTGIASAHAPVPRWLLWNYIFWVLFGLAWFALYWNGSWGFLDRGHWNELQKAANTTFPQIERAKDQYES